jgi:D-alanyl-D-alanine carboxypeptidase
VTSLQGQLARIFLLLGILTLVSLFSVTSGRAAPFAAIVVDARTGETLYANNADTRLHPASLTKMLTLYIAFDAIERGEISLDTQVVVSRNAASKPPSRLGLKAGQRIALRYLIRAAAVKSANDAASAIGDALSGDEASFAKRMNQTAKAIGMRNSTFRNANGLTAAGHMSTARDMNHLGRRLFYDFPQYYNIFSRRKADAGMAQVNNTNTRFLDAYKGADGIKTGYTNPAGFNLTASAERGNKRIIATVFGGTSTAMRNKKMAELMDLGFGNAPANARISKPAPADLPQSNNLISSNTNVPGSAGKTIRLVTSLKVSPRPRARPGPPGQVEAAAEVVLAMQDGIADALALATAPPKPVPTPTPEATATTEAVVLAEVTSIRPAPKPEDLVEKSAAPAAVAQVAPTPTPPASVPETVVALSAPTPQIPFQIIKSDQKIAKTAEPEIVTRISTSGGRHWGINLGKFTTRAVAERALMKTALTESATLRDGLRKVVERKGGYDANFIGLSRDQADLACRRLQARAIQCFTLGP